MNDAKFLKVEEDFKETWYTKFKHWWFVKTSHTWYGSFRNWLRNFFRGFKNLYKWHSVVWNDVDWGYDQIYKVLKFKIKNTRNYLIKHNFIADFHIEKINRYCTLCLKLIDKIENEFYQLEYLDYFESEFNFIPKKLEIEGKEENVFELDIKEISSTPTPYFKKYKSVYKLIKKKVGLERPDKINDDKFIAFEMSHYNHEHAKKVLFNILAEQIEYWWD